VEENQLIRYLNKLKFEEDKVDLVRDMLYTSENLICEEIINLFITDYLVGEEREFKNLYFFSEHFLVECKKFIQCDEYHVYSLPQLISRVSHSVKSFDFKEVNNKSRFHMEIVTIAKDTIEMKATGNNCSSLYEIYKKHILPYFSK
jgi:hypothetical protein